MKRIAVVGGSLAGVHSAEALRELGFDGDVTLVSAETSLPYDRPPLSKAVLLGGDTSESLLLRNEAWYEEMNINVELGNPARGIDRAAGNLVLQNGSELAYDGLVVATGSTARMLRGYDGGPKVHVLRSIDDAVGLKNELLPGRHLVIVGAGFIGLEVAAAAHVLGLDVTVIEGSATPLARRFGDVVGDWYRNLHELNGVRIVCGSALAAIDSSGKGVKVTLGDGNVIAGDVLVAGVGAAPAIEWLAGSGIEVADGVVCSADLRTSVPNIVAAGDVASWHNPIFDEQMRIEHWSNAVDQGRHAAATLLGEREPFASVPYFWTDQHMTKMRFVGRTKGVTDTHIETLSDDKLVATFGRDGVLIGAVCIGAPRLLPKYKMAIQARAPWEAVAETVLVPAQ